MLRYIIRRVRKKPMTKPTRRSCSIIASHTQRTLTGSFMWTPRFNLMHSYNLVKLGKHYYNTGDKPTEPKPQTTRQGETEPKPTEPKPQTTMQGSTAPNKPRSTNPAPEYKPQTTLQDAFTESYNRAFNFRAKIIGDLSNDPSLWTVEKVYSWARFVVCIDVDSARKLRSHKIDGKALLDISDKKLKSLQMPGGDMGHLLKGLKLLKAYMTEPPSN